MNIDKNIISYLYACLVNGNLHINDLYFRYHPFIQGYQLTHPRYHINSETFSEDIKPSVVELYSRLCTVYDGLTRFNSLSEEKQAIILLML